MSFPKVNKKRRKVFAWRYVVRWRVAGEQQVRPFSYITRAETFAEKKRAKGFEVQLWDTVDLKQLTF